MATVSETTTNLKPEEQAKPVADVAQTADKASEQKPLTPQQQQMLEIEEMKKLETEFVTAENEANLFEKTYMEMLIKRQLITETKYNKRRDLANMQTAFFSKIINNQTELLKVKDAEMKKIIHENEGFKIKIEELTKRANNL